MNWRAVDMRALLPHARDFDQPTLRYQLIEGDIELLPGLTLLETSGHAPGHQSVLVRLPQTGPVLLAIDAVVQQRLFTLDRRAWPDDENEEQLRASTQNSWIWSSASTSHWSSLAMMVSSGERSRKHLPITNEGMSRQS